MGKKPAASGAPTSVALDQLLSADQSAILRLIEKLRPINKYNIDLPRIIVCGDQSCGKSSVLEAISRLTFPRDEKLCTTFATELTLNHQTGSGVSVNIVWDNPKQGAEEFQPRSTAVEDLCSTINEAKRIMERRNEKSKSTFFRDILQVSAANPSWPPLTLVDLPGLISAGADRDVATVNEIVQTHMKEPKTIILAVVQALNDAENQGILKLVEKLDPERKRTMGIITKPDQVQGPKQEKDWIEMALNKSLQYKFELGWHVIRNRSPAEADLSFDERDQKEREFFANSAWGDELKQDQCGIDNLRLKLSKILEERTRAALPGIVRELEEKLESCKKSLLDLGPARETPDDQQKYLIRIGTNFQEIAKNAVAAHYQEEFFTNPRRRYYAYIRAQNDQFAKDMRDWGHTFQIDNPSKTKPKGHATGNVPGHVPGHFEPPIIVSRAEFIDQIKQIQVDYAGHELHGMCNPEHLTLVFRKQSRRWRGIAKAHLEVTWGATYDFLKDVALYAAGTGNEHSAAALMRYIIDPEMKKKRQSLLQKLDELLRPVEVFPIMTHDQEFLVKQTELYEKLEDTDRKNLTYHLSAGQGEGTEIFVKERLLHYKSEKTEFPSSSSQMLDLMQLYYKNALRTFVDNVVSLAIHNCLVHELPALFNPSKVQDIASENKPLLEALASEPPKARQNRQRLQEKKGDLQKALDDCRNQLGDYNMYLFNSMETLSLSEPHSPSSMASAGSHSTLLTVPSVGDSISEKGEATKHSRSTSRESFSIRRVETEEL